jgi:presenilin-like A22 family membrane protease
MTKTIKQKIDLESIFSLIILSLILFLAILTIVSIAGVNSYTWMILPTALGVALVGSIYGGCLWYAFNSNVYGNIITGVSSAVIPIAIGITFVVSIYDQISI